MIGSGDFCCIVRRSETKGGRRDTAQSGGRTIEAISFPALVQAAGYDHHMIEGTRDQRQAVKPRAARCIVQMVVAEYEARSARQAGQRVFQRGIVPLVREQP